MTVYKCLENFITFIVLLLIILLICVGIWEATKTPNPDLGEYWFVHVPKKDCLCDCLKDTIKECKK